MIRWANAVVWVLVLGFIGVFFFYVFKRPEGRERSPWIIAVLAVVLTLVGLFTGYILGARAEDAPKESVNNLSTENAGRVEDHGEETASLREHLRASLVVETATYLIAVVTIVFAIFLGALGYLEIRRFTELQQDIKEKGQALDERIKSFWSDFKDQQEKLTDERKTLDTRVEQFKADLKKQEDRLVVYQRFLDAVLSHHSDLLLGIIGGFGSALTPEENQRLRSLISETEATLNLFHPDTDEVRKALMRLDHLGADNAVNSLVRLLNDPDTGQEIGIKAQKVLDKIRERLKEARKAPPA